MRGKRTRFAIAAFAAIALQINGAVAANFPPPLRVPDGLGVNIHFTQAQPGEIEMLTEAGLQWIRMDFSWPDMEKAKGTYDFTAYDRLVDTCDKHHLRVMAIFDYANPLYDDNQSPHTNEAIAAFANWAVALVKHFQGKGILWEMYNEPNGFWRPKPDVNAYVKLALAVAKAVKTAAPNELQCGPGLSGTDGAWLEPCYRAGLLNYWNAVSVHPYGDEPPETRERHYQGVRALIDRYQPKGKPVPILSGEWGYTAARVSRQTQAEYVARQFLFNLYSGIPLSIWYDWRDDGTNPREGEHNFGLVANAYQKDRKPVLETKPAYVAVRTLISQLNGFTFNKRIPLAESGDFFLVFTNCSRARATAWTTSAQPHATTVPTRGGKISVLDFQGAPLPAIQADEKGLNVQFSSGPKYLFPNDSKNSWNN